MSLAILDERLLAATPLPALSGTGGKEDRGSVLVVAGGGAVPGAPVLTGLGALRSGAGKLQMVATRATAVPLGIAVPESLILWGPQTGDREIGLPSRTRLAAYARGADAVVIGPGMMGERIARAFTAGLLALFPHLPAVVDAAALPSAKAEGRFPELAAVRTVLTPHAGEMAGMLALTKEEVLTDPLGMAREAAARFQSVIVMKGPTTFVSSPSGLVWRHDGGVTGLGTSGSGDVLAGVIGGLLARGAPPLEAALWGVYVHAVAGRRLAQEIGPIGFIASDLLAAIPRVLAETSGAASPGGA